MFEGMRTGWRRLVTGRLLLRELRGIHTELTRLADLQEAAIKLQWPGAHLGAAAVGDPLRPNQLEPTGVSYVTDHFSAELAGIELSLTGATGQPPSEDEIMEEYERRHGQVG